MRQVRRPWEQDRRAAQLERAAAATEPDGQGVRRLAFDRPGCGAVVKFFDP